MKKFHSSTKDLFFILFTLNFAGFALCSFFEDEAVAAAFSSFSIVYFFYCIFFIKVKSILIDENTGMLTIFLLPYVIKREAIKYSIRDLTFTYKDEVSTRMGSKEKKIRVYDKTGDQILFITPELFLWKEKDIKEIAIAFKLIHPFGFLED